MSKTIQELFNGCLFPAEQCGMNNKEINGLTKSLYAIFNELENVLGDRKNLLDNLEETSVRLSALYQEEFFIAGFKVGVKIASEALYT